MINRARRNFMSYLSIMGFIGMSGISLQAQPLTINEEINIHPLDSEFDPDGWL
jgi:riboflavin synthase alpha subunit